jgi:hypothetical protein
VASLSLGSLMAAVLCGLGGAEEERCGCMEDEEEGLERDTRLGARFYPSAPSWFRGRREIRE